MIIQSALGLVLLTALALALGLRKDGMTLGRRLGIAAIGLAIQLATAAVLLKVPPVHQVFVWLNDLVGALESATRAGTGFVFGYLGGGPLPFEETQPGASFVFAFRALPVLLVMSALSALLFHWRILPLVIRGVAWVLQRTLGVGGAVGVATAANVFVGMVEAPMLIRPYLLRLTRSELFVVMTAGMATVAGTVLVLYASILGPAVPDALGHLLTASLISAPAAVMVALLMVPDDAPPTPGTIDLGPASGSAMDAITRGTLQGVTVLINIVAMLVVLVALVHLANQILGLLPDVADGPLTLQRMLGWVMAPVAWLMGLPWAEAATGGALLGTKTILNEFIAYLDLAALPADALSERSRLIMTYALCGFANLGSLGIMIGGLATLAPERRDEVVSLGGLSIVAGTIATCLTGAVVGVLS